MIASLYQGPRVGAARVAWELVGRGSVCPGTGVPLAPGGRVSPRKPRHRTAVGWWVFVRRLLPVLAFVAVVALVVWRLGLARPATARWLALMVRRSLDEGWGVPAFVGGYAVGMSLGLPAAPFALAGGVIFGFGRGFLLSWVAASLGALGAYHLGRLLGGDRVRPALRSRGELLDRVQGERSFRTVLRLRLVPFVPANVLYIVCGAARVPLRSYVPAVVLGMVPGTAILTYFAHGVLAGADGARGRAMTHAAMAGALLVGLSFVPGLVRRWRARRGPR